MVVALPWHYDSRVIVGSKNTADDRDINSLQGRVLPPRAETLNAWVAYIFLALEEKWSLDGGFSPCRSLEVLWPDGEHRYYKAELSMQEFDIEVVESVPEQLRFVVSDEFAKFRIMSEKHVLFINDCLSRFQLEFPVHTGRQECTLRRLSFVNFIEQECMEHICCALDLLEMWRTTPRLDNGPIQLVLGDLLVGQLALAAERPNGNANWEDVKGKQQDDGDEDGTAQMPAGFMMTQIDDDARKSGA